MNRHKPQPTFKHSRLALLLATLPLAAQAEGVDIAAAEALPAVSITATRLPKPIEAVAPNISVLPAAGDDAARVRDIKTLFADEPGVGVGRDPARRGNGSVNIRGLDGNRVLLQVDGVTVPSLYGGGGGAISGRDMVELDSLSAVEVVKGPYSGLYGADAIGGVVAYRSLTVDDLLKPGASRGGHMRTGYYGADKSSKLGGALGFREGAWSGLLSYTGRQGDNQSSMGENDSTSANRTKANPLDWSSNALLGKLAWTLAPGHSLAITQEVFSRSQRGDFLSNYSPAILSQRATDKSRRNRSSLRYDYAVSGSGLVGAKFNLYRQHGESSEFALESRAGGVLRSTNAGFEQDARGIDAQINQRFDLGSQLHTLSWGGEYSRTETSRPRDRTQYNPDGSTSKVVGGEVFPQKAFPDNRSGRLGLFVQDEITLASGMTLTPSLRYDRYTLTPEPDARFANANPAGYRVADYRDSAVSPRLSLSLPLSPGWTGFAQLGTGFRAPNFDDAMLVFSNPAQGYEVLPNPDLKSETSRSLEVGARYHGPALQLAVTAYHSRYRDFIENVLLSPRDTNGNGVNLEYQARNLGKVRIQGLELKALWRMHTDVALRGALAYAKGDDLEDGTPLASVAPLSGNMAVDYHHGDWQASLNWRGAQRKSRLSGATLFRAPGYGVLDLSGSYQLAANATLSAGLYNLADKKYWLWSDVNGLDVSPGPRSAAAVIDRYSQSGRTASIHLEYTF
ncbi:TonB-dependent hemoglobin/transferrin/lactoferrin family receptor [Chitinimonas arctica]|uniref:TonB-dependent hemoglobin/transferrin/lactoferrin family receptor n=1 Tax=Chitinimonas arctica TaxID=2594795 RepID=A0A516SKL4_9NEIS|nr:TonB-dependent hemoglobin/transferrin/lactoferrin family receptor [Chitinimonas arctica]QDQ28689.1 TonB-dependent hemoglobin/transferrin/lactoferrin family receptor [Chitinimonas arctica]